MAKGVCVRFECGSEDRMGEALGPFSYVQQTYTGMYADDDSKCYLAEHVDGWWVTEDGQRWSDFVIFAAED